MAQRATRNGRCLLLVAAAMLPVSAVTCVPGARAQAPVAQATAPHGDPQARTAAYIANLKSELHITAAEAGPWDSFAAVMQKNATEISDKLAERTSGFAKMNAVDDLKNYAEVSELHAQEMTRLVAPFETLYAALSPAQRAEADRLFHDTRGQHGPVHG